jgi:DNA-binding response OmpR family regulator
MNRRAARILWIGPDAPHESVRLALSDHGYVLLRVEPGAHALAACRRLRHDAVVLALTPCDGPALQAAVSALRQQMRERSVLLVLVPQLSQVDEVLLLGAGADAVADPLHGTLVLLARLRRWLRRMARELALPAPLCLGPLEVDGAQCLVRVHGRTLALGASATALVHELAACDGRPATRADLARHLGPASLDIRSRTVDMAISRLRQMLRAEGVRDVAIESVRGRGYRMVLRCTAAAAVPQHDGRAGLP